MGEQAQLGGSSVRYLPALDFSSEETQPAEGALVLPCFPLGETPYVPHSEQVLQIFEPRYRQMYSDILFSGGRRFVVPPIKPQDGAGRISLAEVGVVLYLNELKEVSEQTDDQVKYVCSHSVIGRVRVKKVLNPRVFADRTTYLRVECEDLIDSDADKDCAEEEQSVESLLHSVQELQERSGTDARFADPAGMNATRGAGFWGMVTAWQSYLEQQASQRKVQFDRDLQAKIVAYLKEVSGEVPDQISLSELPPEVQREVIQLQDQFREEMAPLLQSHSVRVQELIQMESHSERLARYAQLLDDERKRLEARIALKDMFEEK